MAGAFEVSLKVVDSLIRGAAVLPFKDILDPPWAIQFPATSPAGDVAVQLIATELATAGRTGTDVLDITVTLAGCSVQFTATGEYLAALGGLVTIAVPLRFTDSPPFVRPFQAPAPAVGLAAVLSAASSHVELDAATKARIQAFPGGNDLVPPIEKIIADEIESQLKTRPDVPVGFVFELTGDRPCSALTQVRTTPSVVFLDGPPRLRVGTEYSAPPTPPLAGDSLLASGYNPIAIGLDRAGFADSIRRMVVRGMAEASVRESLHGWFLGIFRSQHVISDPPTDSDRVLLSSMVDSAMVLPENLVKVDAATPGPVGAGELLQWANPPDPFSGFFSHIYWIDLWMESGHIAGTLKARGDVDGFGFEAEIGFTAVPFIVGGQVQLRDVQVGEPQVSVDLGVLDWAFGVLVSVFRGVALGAVAAILLDMIVNAIAESIVGEETQKQLDKRTKAMQPPALPAGLWLDTLSITPDLFRVTGHMTTHIDDPIPFVQALAIDVDPPIRSPRPDGRPGSVWLACTPILGVLRPSNEGVGEKYEYTVQRASTTTTVRARVVNLPLPVTDLTWEVYCRPLTPHPSVSGSSSLVPLAEGAVPITTTVWVPEPPLWGTEETRSFELKVKRDGEGFTIEVPAQAGNVVVGLKLTGTDGTGKSWTGFASFEANGVYLHWERDSKKRLDQATKACAGERRELRDDPIPGVRDPIGPVWNPPWEQLERLQDLLRTHGTGAVGEIAGLVDAHGLQQVAEKIASRRMGPS